MVTITVVARCLVLACAIVYCHSAAATCSEESDHAVPTTADRSLLHQRRWLWWGDSKDSENKSNVQGKLDKIDRNYASDADNPMDAVATKNLTDNEALSAEKNEAADSSEQLHGDGKLDKFDRNYESDAHNPMDAVAAKGLTDNEAFSGNNNEETKDASLKEEPPALIATDESAAKGMPAIAQGPVPQSLASAMKAVLAQPPESESRQSQEHGKLDEFDRDFVSDADNPMDDAAAKGLTDDEALSRKNQEAGPPTLAPAAVPPTLAPAAVPPTLAPAEAPQPAPTEAPAAAGENVTNGTNETPSHMNDGVVTSPPSTGTTETTTTALGHVVPLCGTRNDPSVSKSSLYYTASPEGTPCVFGVDDRDEGEHCIMDDVKYGSFGWCWTNVQMNSWGSCNATCPLFGPMKVLEDKIEDLRRSVAAEHSSTEAAPPPQLPTPAAPETPETPAAETPEALGTGAV